MRNYMIALLKKVPYIDSVISLMLGATIGSAFQHIVDVCKLPGTSFKQVITACIPLLIVVIICVIYYRLYYVTVGKFANRISRLEQEIEKSKIKHIRRRDEVNAVITEQIVQVIQKDDVAIDEKFRIAKVALEFGENSPGVQHIK